MSLKEAISENHHSAEEHRFTKSLFSGSLQKEAYGHFLFNIMHCYKSLENAGDSIGLFNDLQGIKRSDLINLDLVELFADHNFTLFDSAVKYCEHVNSITDTDKLLAHVYVRYMGDLYGGQMIKRVVPTSGHMYQFENRKELIEKIRSKLTDNMGEEANLCFKFVIDLFEDISVEYNI